MQYTKRNLAEKKLVKTVHTDVHTHFTYPLFCSDLNGTNLFRQVGHGTSRRFLLIRW